MNTNKTFYAHIMDNDNSHPDELQRQLADSTLLASTTTGLRKVTALDKQVGGDHYKKLKIQPIEFIHANNIPFMEGCAIKYLVRWRDKNGIADLEKAKHFIELLIDLESRTK